jgi:signal peptidase I
VVPAPASRPAVPTGTLEATVPVAAPRGAVPTPGARPTLPGVAPDARGEVVTGGTDPAAEVRARNWNRSLIEWTALLAGALLVALLVKVFLFQAFVIPSESMLPTLRVGDRVLVNKLSYDLHDVRRGDIVVFERPPAARTSTDDSDLIKRVIGLPGETVEGHDGEVFVDGRPLREPYLPPGTPISPFPPVTLGRGELFMMGDNRAHSNDSRFFGPVPEDLVVGRAFVRVWPLGALHVL